VILLVGAAPIIALLVARWAWRFHLRALRLVAPVVAAQVGGTAVEIASVLADDHSVLVGLRPSRTGTSPVLGMPSTLVLALDENGSSPVARLQRWQASSAPVLVWRNADDETIELWQLQTNQHMCFHVAAGTGLWGPEDPIANAA
jgi:hypothetical protein